MIAALFEVLLHDDERTTLDFKRDQYRFVKASLEEKAELLKDLLGFANALRRADAYILIGVEDVRGGRGNVVGISEHLDDHSLQQFVAHNTNRTLNFQYEAFTFEGKNVGIIRVDMAQDRPLSLVRDVGRLKAGEVYLRRGSCTDPTKPATADEIALMGRASVLGVRHSEVAVQFADLETGKPIGGSIEWNATNLRVPPLSTIPVYSGTPSSFEITLDRTNPHFYREVAQYAAFLSLFRPARVVIENIGSAPAEDVRIEIEVDEGSVLSMKEYEPVAPARTREIGVSSDVFRSIRRAHKSPGEVEIIESRRNVRLIIECGNMQPGRRVASDKFYLAVMESGPACVSGWIFAATLERPKPFALTIDATISVSDVSVDAIRRFAETID